MISEATKSSSESLLKIIDRGKDLFSLEEKSEVLTKTADAFEAEGIRFRRQMQMQRLKIYIFIGIFIIISIKLSLSFEQ